MSETQIRASIEAFVAAWNERDSVKRMQLLEHACADGIVIRAGRTMIQGRAEVDAWIGSFQQRCPDDRAAFSSAIDVQGSLFRYSGIVESQTGAPGGEAL
ncbi:MAG: hypothetical protein ABI551_22140, partial [Polyangiaceae bacterium]